MTGGHSAAWRPALAAASSAAVARSMKPGLLGAKGRKVLREIPASSAACRKSLRSSRNATLASKSGKSTARTAHFHSSFVGVLASPSSSIRGRVRCFSIVSYLTNVGLSQRDDAPHPVAQGKCAGVHPSVEEREGHLPRFAIVASVIVDGRRPRPIQPRRITQRQPMLRPVRGILRLIPLELDARQSGRAMENGRLTGDPE